MTWRGPDLEGDLPQHDALAVDQRIGLELDLGGLTEGDDRSRLLRQFEMTGEEVGVQVSLDHALYPKIFGRCLVEVDANVAPRIDDDRPPGRLVADEIGRVRKTAQIVLAEDHSLRPFPRDLAGLGHDADIGLGFPPLPVDLLGLVIGHRAGDDHILALLPVDRGRHPMTSR